MLKLIFSTLLAFVLIAAGCGEDGDRSADPSSAAHYSLAEVEAALDRSRLGVVRDRGAITASEVEPAPSESARFATQGGKEFEVLVFPTAADAIQAADEVAATDLVSDGGSYARQANVIAAFPRGDHEAYRVAQRVIGDLAVDSRDPGPT